MKGQSPKYLEMFEAKGASDIYSALVTRLGKSVGAKFAVEDPKGTCVHINCGPDGIAYAGIHPRKGAVLLNIRLNADPETDRVRKVERVSANRFHCEILLDSVDSIDSEVIALLKTAANLASESRAARKRQ